MTLSVIIPTYRRPQSLTRCLDAIAVGSTLPDRVIVVVRDTDTDTQAALSAWAAAQSRLTVSPISVSEAGQIAAMNAGLAAAIEDIVAFIDDDTASHADWLGNLLRHYDDPTVGGVGGRDLIYQDGETLRGTVRAVGQMTWYGRMVGNHHLDLEGGPIEVAHLKGANMSFRRELLPPFDLRMASGSCALNDTDASLAVTDQGYGLIYDPQAVVDHITAPRQNWVTRDITDPRLVYSDSHNWVYCLCKHFPPGRRAVFVAYALLVGEGVRYGVLKLLLALPRQGMQAVRQFGAATRGKLAGYRDFVATIREFAASKRKLVPRQV